jgi:nucleoside-diphosphate-sugar epimerase
MTGAREVGAASRAAPVRLGSPDLPPIDPVLVTGAAGFVGACVARELVTRGHRVHVFLRETLRPWRLAGILHRLVVHCGDLLDESQTRGIIDIVRPSAVVHLAAYGAYERQADASRILQTNILGTHHLLEASAAAGAKIFVNAGSSSEYGFKALPMREDDCLAPNSMYAVAKAAQSHLCALAARRHVMSVANFRLFSVYGPWEEPTRLIPTILRRARADLPLEMVHPDVARDFVYVDDVVEAMLDWPTLSRMRGEIINLGTGKETTLREIVSMVKVLTGSRSEVRWGAFPRRQWDTHRWCADVSRAAEMIGWRAKHDLPQGLAKTLAWMEAHEHEFGKLAAA